MKDFELRISIAKFDFDTPEFEETSIPIREAIPWYCWMFWDEDESELTFKTAEDLNWSGSEKAYIAKRKVPMDTK